MTARYVAAFIAGMSLTFSLGWFASGYLIYKGFYDAGGAYMQDTAQNLSRVKK